MDKLNIFIGYDHKESVAYYTLEHSIASRCSIPVSVTPLMKSQIKNFFYRPKGKTESTDFSLSRFLVPLLSGYTGWSVFMDCDMLCRVDISHIRDYMDPSKAIVVCKHDYVPKTDSKFLGQVQTKYVKKNWSSLILFNNEQCKALTKDYINNTTGLNLHQFKWIDEDKIGELPLTWNWLVGEYDYNQDARIVHFTIGGPYFSEYKDCHYADEWFDEYNDMIYVRGRNEDQ